MDTAGHESLVRNAYLPETGFVRLPTILALIPVGKSTWWAGVRSGRYPTPVKLGPRTTAWRAEDIRRLIETK
jgi:prophage regulatory protein